MTCAETVRSGRANLGGDEVGGIETAAWVRAGVASTDEGCDWFTCDGRNCSDRRLRGQRGSRLWARVDD